MTIRERLEAEEQARLSPFAALSCESEGRARPISDCDLRTCYQRDRDRIIHCKSFRRLKFKTQVFLSPLGDHYRTRLTHTLEVAQVARTLARSLQLNEDLAEAIALGHDLGHTPFGHIGEATLDHLTPGGFRHNVQSLRVAERLENGGKGLNLCAETLDGIRNHSGADEPKTLEGWCVRRADRIAYINHDIDDAIRGGIIYPMDLPLECTSVLGFTHGARIDCLVKDAIQASQGQNEIRQTPEVGEAMLALKDFMFASVYTNPLAKGEESKARAMIQALYIHYSKYPEKLPADFIPQLDFDGMPRVICDYIAGMTDKYAVAKYEDIFIPSAWHVRG